ncbi:glycosyltransferase family 2 protein [Catenovulum sediminis]|uniref:glycosyltransferase family 2 protein n=1 Tax=Catenovulum sediminis TaxID=1740262 RepID=UPI001180D6A1|nr:glycosyltransferase family 2 protein [Catenovulum sediminis]
MRISNLQSNAAVVTTVADAKSHIEFFINYHLSVGFNHIYIFIDDDCAETFLTVSKFTNATAILANELLREAWKHTPIYRKNKKRALIEKEVMVRQELNIHIAHSLAKEQGIDWLVHLDIDELFYPNGNLLNEHFSSLNQNNIGSCVYLNYEAIPTGIENSDIYLSTVFFKKNFFRRSRWFYSDEQKSFIENTSWIRKHFFNYYQNGKPAVSLHNDIIVNNVHFIHHPNRGSKMLGHDDPIILHFPCTSYKEFQQKYSRLGNFDSLWNNLPRTGKYIDTLHIEARDLFLDGDLAGALALYRERVVRDHAQIELLIRYGLAVKIEAISADSPNISTYPGKSTSSDRATYELKSTQKSVFPNSAQCIGVSEIFFQIQKQNNKKHCIFFDNIGDARKWVRRHPILKEQNDVGNIQLDGKFYPCWSGKLLYDFDREELYNELLVALKQYLSNEQILYFDIAEELLFKDCSMQTPFDFSVKQVQFVMEIVSALCEKNKGQLFIGVQNGIENFYYPILPASFVDKKMTEHIYSYVQSRETKKLVEFLQIHYPRNKYSNWGIGLNDSHSRYEIVYKSILFSLGGTVLFPKNYQRTSMDKFFVELRKQHDFIVQNYAEVIPIEGAELVVINNLSCGKGLLTIVNISMKQVVVEIEPLLTVIDIKGKAVSIFDNTELELRLLNTLALEANTAVCLLY